MWKGNRLDIRNKFIEWQKVSIEVNLNEICLQWNPLAITFLFLFFFLSVCGLTSSKMKTEPTEVCQKTAMAKKRDFILIFIHLFTIKYSLSLSFSFSLSVCLSIFFCLSFQAANRLLQRQYCIVPKIKTVNDVCFLGGKKRNTHVPKITILSLSGNGFFLYCSG